ncbi:Translocation protein sec72 [Smittium mucronatum]|uniref:Translocation protein sec72 n=1 Tax=Smittium mucronatum TaxID=133383 RepID=A0A1R0GTI5_9FUNG|nr:Translocation protein sec72 [Smittium mucronatum]
MTLEIKPYGARPTFPTKEDAPKLEIPNYDNMVIIDSIYHCKKHDKQVCGECVVDYSLQNFLTRQMEHNGTGIPSPNPELLKQIQALKTEGNNMFRTKRYTEAAKKYTDALALSNQRPPWDSGQIIADETSVLFCNRSACFLELEKFAEAFWDAEIVVRLKRNWGKGHFRRGKALLGMGRFKEAVESLRLAIILDTGGAEAKTALENALKMI